MNRHPEPLFGELQVLRQKRPCKIDGFSLEIVAKTKIAQHFKKGMVPSGVPHVFEIVVFPAGPDTALTRYCAMIVTRFDTQKCVFKLVHPRVREQQRGIVVRHQGARSNTHVLLPLKVRQKRFSNVSSFHALGLYKSNNVRKIIAPSPELTHLLSCRDRPTGVGAGETRFGHPLHRYLSRA